MEKQIINTPNAPAPIGPYNQAILTGNMLFASGQIALNPATNQLVTDDIVAETHQVMQNVKAILDAGFQRCTEEHHLHYRYERLR